MFGKIENTPQLSIFETPLIQFIDIQHPLCILARRIDWKSIENEFSGYYIDFGRPSVPIRKMVGLTLLKYLKNLSDESVTAGWCENPYWQYFCVEVNFQRKQPFDPSEFVHFRKCIGEEGAEKLLKLTISLFGKEAKEKEVLIDTTVQEKNITFPTDTKLQKRIIDKIVKIAKKEGIHLRQTYTRTLPQLMIEQRQRNHPKRKKKANAVARKIKTIAGRVVRDIDNKMTPDQKSFYSKKLELFKKADTLNFELINEGGKLYLKPKGSGDFKMELKPESETLFFFAQNHDQEIEFILNANGDISKSYFINKGTRFEIKKID